MARQWRNVLHFLGMKCSSRHTFAPIDSTFCTPRKYILASGALGRPTIGYSQPRGGPLPPLYWSVYLPARLLGGPTPFSLTRNGPSRPGGGPTTCLPPPYRCVYHPGGRFFFNYQKSGVHGANFKVSMEHFVTHFPIFSHTKLLLLFLFRIIVFESE